MDPQSTPTLQPAPQASQPQPPTPPSTPLVPTQGSTPIQSPDTATIPLHKGLFIMLGIGDLIFCMPAMWAVIIYYGKYTKAARTGDTEAARKSLKAIKLWGFIGLAIGIPFFILYLASRGNS